MSSSGDDIKAQIEAQGDKIRALKGNKDADPVVLKAEVAALLELKEKYKAVTGQDYAPAGGATQGAKKAKKETPAEQPKPSEAPSKKALKKDSKDKKKAAAKAAKENGGGAAAPTPTANAAATTAKGKGEVVAAKLTYYPSDHPETNIKVLMAASVGGLEMSRGYGTKPGFFGPAPYLEVPGGQVVAGEGAILKAIALLGGGGSGQGGSNWSLVVSDWMEWGYRILAPAVKARDADSLIALVAHVNKALTSCPYLAGDAITVADIAVAPMMGHALGFFGETENAKAREWLGRVTGSEAWKWGENESQSTSFLGSDVDFDVEEHAGLLSIVRAIFTAAMHKAFPESGELGFAVADVARCAVAKFGDYQCNSPMSMYRALKARNHPVASRPQAVAEAMIAQIPPQAYAKVLQEAFVSGAGFINVRIRPDYIHEKIRTTVQNGVRVNAGKKLKVLVDFSSPNIAKEMHVGHLRSTIIGDTICRVLEFLGHEVMRINHVGDWGTQFGMLITYLKAEYPDFMTNPPNIGDLTTFYKNAKKCFDDSADFKERSRLGVVALQAGDAESRAIWKMLCEISRAEFQKVYDRLEVRLEECGESFYNGMIPAVIDELQSKGLLELDNGATIMRCGEKYRVPLMMRKSDGGFGYDSTDMAAISYRLRELKCDWVVYITDSGQSDHFTLIFEAARIAGWLKEPGHRVDHIGFGVVQGEDGKRLKTRSGETVRLVDLLDEAVGRMKSVLEERVKEGKSPLKLEDVPAAAAAIGYGAVKYFDLRQNPINDYQFSYDRMLDTRGETAVYLLFAYARLKSILRKAQEEKGVNIDDLITRAPVVIEHPAEVALAMELVQLPDVLNEVVERLSPNRMCEYLYAVSCKTMDFLEACFVIGSEPRLVLVQAASEVMRTMMELLGLHPLSRI